MEMTSSNSEFLQSFRWVCLRMQSGWFWW